MLFKLADISIKKNTCNFTMTTSFYKITVATNFFSVTFFINQITHKKKIWLQATNDVRK